MQQLTFTVQPITRVLAEGLSGDGSLVDQAYVLLRRQIVSLALPPESPLVEQEVASALKISKTPVREAIIRLSREGLVQVIPKSGSYVTAISLDRYFEACFIRMQLEVGCVRHLAQHGTGMADQVKLKSLVSEQTAALDDNDDAYFFELDEAFHRQLFAIARLSTAWELMQTAKAEIDRVRHLKRYFGIRQRQLVIEEHAAVIEGIIARDPDAAERALLANIGGTEEEIRSLSENPQLLRTIDDLNDLVRMDGRSRGSRKVSRA